jgi:DMSO/TMAO reductase YedYZ molybdopterin-dependent catalytic subunit
MTADEIYVNAMTDKQPPAEGARAKLIASKEGWAREGRLITGRHARPESERLPPGQRRVEDWPVLDLGIQPDVALDRWELEIDGSVARPRRWTWAEFQGEPRVTSRSDIHCVTQWSRYDNDWEGVAARHLLATVEPLAEARFLMFTSYDDYTTNLPLSDFDGDDVLLADRWQGQPISRAHGGPLRAIVPKLYFWKSAKWLRRITFMATDRAGFWEERGYHMRGDPWKEERYG